MTDSRKLKIRVGLVFAGIALLVAAGGIIAGNMGISLTINMSAAGASPEGGGSASGTNYIALPYNQKFGMNTAKDLFADIGSAQFLNQHRKVDDGFEVYTFGGGTLPPVGWDLKAGEAYIAKVGGSVAFAAPGSHFPDTVVEFIGGASPDSASGTNYFAPPFHSAAATARDMFIEMGGGVQFLNQHRKVDDGFEVYTFGGGTLPPNGWSFVAGEGIIVKVGGVGQRYRPLHY